MPELMLQARKKRRVLEHRILQDATKTTFSKIDILQLSERAIKEHVRQLDRFQCWLDTLLDYSPYTVDNYRQLLAHLERVLGFPVEHATLDDLLSAIRWFKEVREYAGSSMKSLCAALRSFLRFAGRNADADEIPTFSTRWLPPV